MENKKLELKDFPLKYKEGKFFNSQGKEIAQDNYHNICLCANYGKRALLKKKMKSFPDMSLDEAEYFAITDALKEGYKQCLPSETEYQYTIRVFNSKKANPKIESRILNFKKK